MTPRPFSDPLAAYDYALKHLEFVEDSAQREAATALSDCLQALHHWQSHRQGPAPQGVYLWGPVGRGKTWLMDRFCESLQVPAWRQHFHHFMRHLHKRLFAFTGLPDPLAIVARELAAEYRVICLDEFFVADIGDAMLLGRLMHVLFAEKVVLVSTSNLPPDRLYAHGQHQDRFDPAIAAIKARMRIQPVDGGEDHRLHPGQPVQRFWVNDQPAMTAAFDELAARQPDARQEETELALGARRLAVKRRQGNLLWCEFSVLCQKAWSAADYIQLCQQHRALFISGVPCLSAEGEEVRIARGTEDGAKLVEAGERSFPMLSKEDDGARRFIALVDECYEQGVPLYVEAAVPLRELYPQGFLAFPFQRTLSRLQEMQFERFGRGIEAPEPR
ncbi:cell division protein ZapE [Pokkaliibacter sp. CJK22405]|uniref:cell division protein ZapE n=1 Tax=Pokkaliibacter sp. CJK22405 TaxID=3384615 RepID=UPI003984F453